jgi:hypothetical protein
LERIRPGKGGEIQLTDGIASLLAEEQVLAFEFDGIRYDCGSKLGYLKAALAYALKHAELKEEFSEYLEGFVDDRVHSARRLRRPVVGIPRRSPAQTDAAPLLLDGVDFPVATWILRLPAPRVETHLQNPPCCGPM